MNIQPLTVQFRTRNNRTWIIVEDLHLGRIRFSIPPDANPQTPRDAFYAALRPLCQRFERTDDATLSLYVSDAAKARQRAFRQYIANALRGMIPPEFKAA